MVEKLIRDGKVAVLISPGFGGGWSTWNSRNAEFLLFDKTLIELFLAGLPIEEYIEEHEEHCYLWGVDTLTVEWIPVGIKFNVEEYDGHEYIVREDKLNYTA